MFALRRKLALALLPALAGSLLAAVVALTPASHELGLDGERHWKNQGHQPAKSHWCSEAEAINPVHFQCLVPYASDHGLATSAKPAR